MQPALDQLLVGFQVELQSVGAIAETESLVRAGRRAGQVHSARRKVEGVRVPLEHMLIAIEMAAERIATGRGCGMKTIPANLADVVRSHACAERRGQQLRAEANAQDRNARARASWIAVISVVR